MEKEGRDEGERGGREERGGGREVAGRILFLPPAWRRIQNQLSISSLHYPGNQSHHPRVCKEWDTQKGQHLHQEEGGVLYSEAASYLFPGMPSTPYAYLGSSLPSPSIYFLTPPTPYTSIHIYLFTCSSEGVPEAYGEPKPLLHGTPHDDLFWIVIFEGHDIIYSSLRAILHSPNT